MADIELDGLSKSYGQTSVLEGLCLQVRDGELMVLLGPSGGGKSTVLRLIAGLEPPASGTIKIGSRAVNRLPPERRNVSMVFQDSALYPHMSVFKNIAFPLRGPGCSRAMIDDRVNAVAAQLQIGHLLDRRPDQLSGGQQQRVAVARAVARKSDVLLMDEPMSNADARLRDQMRTELRNIQQDLGLTIIYVTHDQNEAMLMADRIAILKDGKIQQVGCPDEVYDAPTNRFVAEFVGSPPMNFIQHGDVTLGIRPEALVFESTSDQNLAFTGTVELIQSVGYRQIIYLRCNEQTLAIASEHHQKLKPGEAATVFAPNRQQLHFDILSGNRI